MLDIQRIRKDTEAVKRGLESTGADPAIIDRVLELDQQRRALKQEGDELRAELNKVSKQIGREKDPEKKQAVIASLGELKGNIKDVSARAPKVEDEFQSVMLTIPNVPLEEVRVGASDEENEVVEVKGEAPAFDFEPKPHWELMTALGIIDFERGQKISGSRFYLLKNDGARLQRALITWMLDMHLQQNGYEEVYTPCMVREVCLVGTGNLPKFGENLYRDAEEDYWFIPTAEVPLTNMYRDEILQMDTLPVKHVACTPCFRREKMSHGKDTRGIKRGHQFDKVEMVQLVHPEKSRRTLDEMVAQAGKLLEMLGLRHRLIKMCTADLSFVSCLKFDFDAWAPGCDEWLEVSSLSLFGDFQARRAKIRYKDENKKNRFVHTLNGSGLALPRIVISIVETYQQADGTILIPEVLRPYMGGQEKIG